MSQFSECQAEEACAILGPKIGLGRGQVRWWVGGGDA